MSLVKRLGAILAVSAIAMTSVHAATLEHVNGTVRLSRGEGFKPMTGSERVRAGDMVLVEAKSKGTLLFSDGCSVPVPAGTVFTVPEVSPCSMTAQVGAPAPAAGAGFGGGGGLGGLAGLAGIAAVGGAALAGATIAANSSNSEQSQRQALTAAIVASQQTRSGTP